MLRELLVGVGAGPGVRDHFCETDRFHEGWRVQVGTRQIRLEMRRSGPFAAGAQVDWKKAKR